jgi:hypothetical protein
MSARINLFAVAVDHDGVAIGAPPHPQGHLTRGDAINLATWIIALARITDDELAAALLDVMRGGGVQ